MSQIAELAVLQRQVKDLEDSIKTIERGLSKKELRLRDEFAMAAMQGLVTIYESTTVISDLAYQVSDAMLNARGEK